MLIPYKGLVPHIHPTVYIGEGAKVVDSVLMPGVLVEEGAEIYKAIIDEGVVVKSSDVINKEAKEVELVSDNA